MAKKFSLLLAAIAVVAFAVPAFASAGSPEVTVNGVKAANGTLFTGTSTNTITKTSIGNLTCAEVKVNGEITANTGTTVAGKATGPASTTTCFFKGVTPITIDDATLLSLHASSATPDKGTVGLTFEATLPELTCHYEGTAVPFTYHTTSNVLTLKGGLVAKPPACGTASIEGTFTTTSPGGAVVLH